MAKQEPATAPAPDSPEALYAAQKAAFEAAKAKTAQQNGAKAPKEPKAAKEPEPEKAPETPAETPEPVKAEAPPLPLPKPKKAKAEKPKAPAAPDALAAVTAQLAALEAKLSALTAPKSQEPEPDDDDPLEGVKAKLTERFGEDEAGALLEALEAIHAPAAQRIAQLEQVIKDAHAHGRKNIAKSNRSRLAEDFPHLKVSDDAWDMLNNLVTASFEKNPKAYGSVEEAYDDIAEKLYGSLRPVESEESDEEDDDEKQASRIAASQMTPPRVAGQRQQRSRIEKQREHFEYMKKNPGDKEGARRLARELGIDR